MLRFFLLPGVTHHYLIQEQFSSIVVPRLFRGHANMNILGLLPFSFVDGHTAGLSCAHFP